MRTKNYLAVIVVIVFLIALLFTLSLPAAGTEATGARIRACWVDAYVADTDPNGVNVRSGPGSGYPLIATLRNGDRVTITGSAGEWMRIDNTSPAGWVYGPLLGVYSLADPDNVWGWQDPSGLVPMLAGEGEDWIFNSGIVAWVPGGTALRIIGCARGSVKVRYNNAEGWLRLNEHTEEFVPPSSGKPGKEDIPSDNVAAYVIDDDPKGVNLRFGPGTAYPSIVTLPTDRPVQVTITGALGEWVLIKNAVFTSKEDGQMTMDITAWVKASLLGVRAENAEDFAGPVSLYKDANAESGVVAEVPGGTGVTVLAARGAWLKVRHDKQEGWLPPDAQCGDPFKECH